jgi:phosphoribosylanthranilate isomerase
MTWIKICGTTNLEDAQLAVEAGADALGFVFYDKSPRNIDTETAREIVSKLPPSVEKVGVFVEQTAEQISQVCEHAALTAAQFRPFPDGTGVPELSKENYRLIVSLPGQLLTSEEGCGWFFSDEFLKRVSAILLDSGTAECPGGTGKTFDWKKAHGMIQGLSLTLPIIVAGGLTPRNVGEAVKLFQPYGVDVASGVEAKPGKKDPEKVKAFVRAVREADKFT